MRYTCAVKTLPGPPLHVLGTASAPRSPCSSQPRAPQDGSSIPSLLMSLLLTTPVAHAGRLFHGHASRAHAGPKDTASKDRPPKMRPPRDAANKDTASDDGDAPDRDDQQAQADPAEALPVNAAHPEGHTAKAARAASKDGSIWDWIEAADDLGDGTTAPIAADAAPPVDTEAVEGAEELAESHEAELSVIAGSARYESPISFFVDPKGTLDVDPLHLREVNPSEFDIPVVVNDAVIKWMEYFTGRGRKFYARYLARSTRYQPMMREKLTSAGLPKDLVYLSMIESGYNQNAYSSAAAAGLWQFIASTGRMYDLKVDFWLDQRRDPQASTDAAIALLGDLYKDYGDWYLAWAAYNAGPGRVDRALKTWGRQDFWTLVNKGAFRVETDNYIPKLLAAAIIGKHPERYGFVGIDYEKADEIEAVDVGSSISIDVLAKCAGVSETEFQRLNPQLRRWATPPEAEANKVYLPKGKSTSFLVALEKVPPEQRLTFVHHTVRRGETLSVIAGRYGSTLSEVQRANRISNPNRIYPGMDLVIPRPGTSLPEALTASAGTGSRAPSSPSHPTTSSHVAPKVQTITHTVQRGEALSTIARRYGVSQRDLQNWNGIHNADHVMAGQHLKIHTNAPSWTSYSVRPGDTLSTIASRYHVSISDLQSWNNLRGSRIMAGQKLKIRR